MFCFHMKINQRIVKNNLVALDRDFNFEKTLVFSGVESYLVGC